MFREVAIQSNQILEKTDYVIRICGVREYLHQNQILGNIIYVRDALRTKNPIIFTIVEKQTVGEEYDALVVPNDLSVPQELSRGQIDKTLVVPDRPSAHRENSPATTEYTDASQLGR
jgi:hypothetical protein